MSIPLFVRAAAAGGLTLCLAVVSPAAANAQVNIWKECGTRYQAAKAANELNGQSWQDFLKVCRGSRRRSAGDPRGFDLGYACAGRRQLKPSSAPCPYRNRCIPSRSRYFGVRNSIGAVRANDDDAFWCCPQQGG